MKNFKIADCWISISLIVLSVIVSIVKRDGTFIKAYFVVGAWQIISMLVHYLGGWFMVKGGKRAFYHKVVLYVLFTGAILFLLVQINEVAVVLLVIFLMLLLICAPLMAVYYAWLCYEETYSWLKRPLHALK